MTGAPDRLRETAAAGNHRDENVEHNGWRAQ